MPMNRGSTQDHPVPLFLTDRGDVAEQLDSSRILKTALVVLTVSAIGAAVFAFGEPVTRLAAVTASLLDVSAPQSDNASTPPAQPVADVQAPPPVQASPAIQAPTVVQSTADVQAPPATVPDAPVSQQPAQEIRQDVRKDMAAASQPANPPQAESSEASSDALFRQFQAWSKEQDSRQASRAPGPQAAPAQDSPAKVESDARAPARTAKKHRRVRAIQNARAEMRAARHSRARVLRERSAQARPIENARAQDVPVQNAPPPQPQSPSPLSQFFGWQ